MKPYIAVIGGSGLYDMPGLEDIQKHELSTPFGNPSAPIIEGTLEGKRVAFLARHGIGHHISPSEINNLANIYALKSLGIERVISVSACGSYREDYKPGDIVIPDQLFDFTKERDRTFFKDGLVAHIGCADPFCPDLSEKVFRTVNQTGARVHTGGTYITIEGPRFSTKGEANIFRSWGVDLIGMTTSPEAFLAREAEMCYAVMAHVTDYDVWHETEEPVSAEMVFRIINKNLDIARDAIRKLVPIITGFRDCDCENALANALTTYPTAISPQTRKKLSLLVDKYLK
jgi:5'-methylthioadenosine phosphorylase